MRRRSSLARARSTAEAASGEHHARRARGRAAWLIERRERLIAQLPRRPSRPGVARDVQELIVDEAIEFASLEHDGESPAATSSRALFWSACEVRVRRAREGRYDTVRAGWQRADTDGARAR